jgi:hypothetical protein
MPHYLVISTDSNWAYSVELTAGQTYRLGRAENNDINLKDPWISSYHARLSVEDRHVVVTDLGSRNGLRKNGEKITEVRMAHKDRIHIGNTELLYVTQLDPMAIGTQAYLSPKLSEPFMKTEVQKIASVSRTLSHVRDGLMAVSEHANGARDSIRNGASQLDVAIDRLRDIEEQARILVATNRFHEIFHTGTDLKSTLQSAVKFLTTAMEAENGALVLLRNGRWFLESVTGRGLEAWSTGIPRQFVSLFEQIRPGLRALHLPHVGGSPVVATMPSGDLFRADLRSVLVAGFYNSSGELAGVGYFDNVTHPEWLKPESTGLASSCLAVVARYVLNDDSIFGTHISRQGMAAVGVDEEESSREHTQFM